VNSNQSDTACSTIRAFADAPYIATLKRGPDSQAKRWSISQKSLSSQRSLCAPQLPLYRAFSRSDSAFTGASIRGNVAPTIRAACRSNGVISTIYSATEKRACCTIVAMTPVAMTPQMIPAGYAEPIEVPIAQVRTWRTCASSFVYQRGARCRLDLSKPDNNTTHRRRQKGSIAARLRRTGLPDQDWTAPCSSYWEPARTRHRPFCSLAHGLRAEHAWSRPIERKPELCR
jgi:hypothetical protein